MGLRRHRGEDARHIRLLTTPLRYPPRQRYRQTGADLAADLDGDDEDYETRSAAFQRFRRELLEAEREAVLRLRSEGKIRDEVMRKIERDLEDSRLEI